MSRPGAVVCGTGFGARVHVPALRAAGFEVAALVGTDGERTARRAARLGIDRALTSLDAALEIPGAVAVTVATPPATHLPVTLRALDAGMHVVCEKPLARDAAEAAHMRDAAASAGRIALVGTEFRFRPGNAAIRAAIAEGRIGAPRRATVVAHVGLLLDGSVRMPGWWSDAGAGGGWLLASGSHTVDSLRWWLGEVAAVSGTLLPLAAGTADAGFAAHLRFDSGAEAVVDESAATHGPPLSVTRVAGEAGTLWLEGGVARLAEAGGELALNAPAAPPAERAEPPDHPAHRFTHLELGPWTALATELHRAAVDGVAPTQAATFDDGLAVLEVLDAIRTSADRGGGVVSLPR